MSGLARSKLLLSLLKEHLQRGDEADADPLLETVVVNYLLTTAYAEIETQVRNTLAVFSEGGVSEPRVGVFARNAVTKVVRSVKCGDIAGALSMFDAACKIHFQEAVTNTPAQAAFDRIVTSRHQQAHGPGSTMTLSDFETDLVLCETILDALEQALRCA